MVLDDCRYSLGEWRNAPQGAAWRVQWCGTLVLLSTVGDVLRKNDAVSSPEMKLAYCQWWIGLGSSKPKPEIYWEFINKHQNLVVHEYRFLAGQSVTVRPGTGKHPHRDCHTRRPYDLHLPDQRWTIPWTGAARRNPEGGRMVGAATDRYRERDANACAVDWSSPPLITTRRTKGSPLSSHPRRCFRPPLSSLCLNREWQERTGSGTGQTRTGQGHHGAG